MLYIKNYRYRQIETLRVIECSFKWKICHIGSLIRVLERFFLVLIINLRFQLRITEPEIKAEINIIRELNKAIIIFFFELHCRQLSDTGTRTLKKTLS